MRDEKIKIKITFLNIKNQKFGTVEIRKVNKIIIQK